MPQAYLKDVPEQQKHWLVAAARRSHRTRDAAAIVIDAVERAAVGPEHAGLDELMD